MEDQVLEAQGYILSQIIAIVPEQIGISQYFLEKLARGSLNAKRLLFCIGIDVKVAERKYAADGELGSLLENLVTIIEDTVELETNKFKTYPVSVPVEIIFGICLRSHWVKNKVNFIPIDQAQNEMFEFIKIVKLSDYIPYIVKGKNNAYLNGTGDEDMYDEEEERSGFYKNEYVDKNKYRHIKVSYLGSSTGWVFFAERKHFFKSIENTNNLMRCKEIIDRLGFYINKQANKDLNNDLLIEFNYPTDFDQPTFRPYTLIGDWGSDKNEVITSGNEYYMSYPNHDEWGRTFSISGKTENFKERFHLEFDLKTENYYNFKSDLLGEYPLITDVATELQILSEAYERFKNV